MWLPFVWGLFVGFVYSLTGAAGGILASFGLISLMGLTDPNQVKPMAQALTLAAPLVAVPAYLRQGRVVTGLALMLGAGGIIGALIGSSLSVRYLADLTVFRRTFALLVLVIVLQLMWSLRSRERQSRTRLAAAAFERQVSNADPHMTRVHSLHWSPLAARVTFCEVTFGYCPWAALAVGFGVAVVSSALGVGGGFLLVPFMAVALQLPMFIVAGTAALAVLVSSAASISSYLSLGVKLDIPLLTLLLVGTIAGSFLGPRISRHLRERWLRGLLVLLLLGIALRYIEVA